jgi:hypothetical protein
MHACESFLREFSGAKVRESIGRQARNMLISMAALRFDTHKSHENARFRNSISQSLCVSPWPLHFRSVSASVCDSQTYPNRTFSSTETGPDAAAALVRSRLPARRSNHHPSTSVICHLPLNVIVNPKTALSKCNARRIGAACNRARKTQM